MSLRRLVRLVLEVSGVRFSSSMRRGLLLRDHSGEWVAGDDGQGAGAASSKAYSAAMTVKMKGNHRKQPTFIPRKAVWGPVSRITVSSAMTMMMVVTMATP